MERQVDNLQRQLLQRLAVQITNQFRCDLTQVVRLQRRHPKSRIPSARTDKIFSRISDMPAAQPSPRASPFQSPKGRGDVNGYGGPRRVSFPKYRASKKEHRSDRGSRNSCGRNCQIYEKKCVLDADVCHSVGSIGGDINRRHRLRSEPNGTRRSSSRGHHTPIGSVWRPTADRRELRATDSLPNCTVTRTSC
jgi:hypothetical protein